MKRSAFALPEVLVAILVLSIGILGLASSGTFLAIQAGEARAITEGSVVVGRVLDSLRSLPCAALASGQVNHRYVTVRWTTAPASRTVFVRATVELPGRKGVRVWPVETLLPC